MGIQLHRKQNLGRDVWPNHSGSGVSGSRRIGPMTINNRSGYTVRLGKGLTLCGHWKKK